MVRAGGGDALDRNTAGRFRAGVCFDLEEAKTRSVVVKASVFGVAAASAATAFRTHEATQRVAHVGFDFFGVFAGFQAFDGDVQFFGHTSGGHDFFHFAHHVGHV